mmetsp:Transcript_35688/g.31484  ORF Transcript_35688/g.31484 Transcript_35688/m.31484 type:complete len:192 (+) Transcript_35688:17-592(+)
MSAIFKSMRYGANLAINKGQFIGPYHAIRSVGTVYQFDPVDIDGNKLALSAFTGNVLLITNVASRCGFTQANYDELTRLSETYNSQGLKICLFPCNQFMCQEPLHEEKIQEFVSNGWPNLAKNAQLFSKVFVNDSATEPLYEYLKDALPGRIEWNFSAKFVIDKNGMPVRRFDRKSSWKEIEETIRVELEK